MLESERSGKAKTQVLGDRRHRRDQRQRIVHRNLSRLADCRVAITIEHVIDANHIGDEQTVELATFQQLGQIRPVLLILVLP
ncbi:hypothetical protein D3C85_1712960 [compost metagenome]